MKTITLRADEALINQILAISKALASTTNQSLETLSIEQVKAEVEQAERIENYKADIEAYKAGALETEPLGKGWKYLK